MMILLIVMTGVMAGVYFIFSVVIMKSLAKLPALQAANVMNTVNDVIVNTLFLPVFFGSTLWYAGLIVWSFADWQPVRSILVIIAALIYILGMFALTAFGNVPLNNQLKSYENNEPMLVSFWGQYLRRWTQLNHVRMISCMASCAVLVFSQTHTVKF